MLLKENANGGFDSVTAVTLKGYCIYRELGQLAKISYIQFQVSLQLGRNTATHVSYVHRKQSG